jgi:hypothetical protein
VVYSLFEESPPPDEPVPPGQPDPHASSRRLTVFIQVLGLVATGWIIWLTSVSPRLHRYTWASLAMQAFGFACFAWLWSAIITFALYFAIPRRERGDVLESSLRTSASAVWFAPAIILLTQLSPAAFAASLVLVVTATRLLYSQWRALLPLEEPKPPRARALFDAFSITPPVFLKVLAPALATAFCAQCGIIAIAMRVPLAGAGFLAAAAALLTVYALSSGAAEPARKRTLPQAAFGVILTVVLASAVTIGGLSGRVAHRRQLTWEPDPPQRPGLLESLRATLREVFYGEQPPGLQTREPAKPRHDSPGNPEAVPQLAGNFPEGSFPGVVLLPEVRSVPMLVAPVPFHDYGLRDRPMAIPFGGEYWFYRQRYTHPPPNSFYRHGTPTSLSFSTTDHWPLEMEARQKFDQPIDLACCRSVQVQIWNADRHPGTVSLDFFALDSDGSFPRSQYFGSARVKSIPDVKDEQVVAVPEILEFSIPPDPLDHCMAFRVVFRRDRSRADKSARIAIERFTLVR